MNNIGTFSKEQGHNSDMPGYFWIAGGASVKSFGGVSIYVRSKKRSGDYAEIHYPYGTLIKLKYTEIFVCKPGYPDYNFFFPMVGWDYAIIADMVADNSAIPHMHIMITYDHQKSTWCRFNYKKCKEKLFFADSGGFQILKGKTDFIDPVDLAVWYNEHTNFGMALDIPFSSSIYNSHRKSLAKIQRKNLDILCENIDDTVQLYNISHGFNNETRKMYIDQVDRPDVNRWAIGLHGLDNYQSLISQLYTVFRHRPAKTYHLLGTSDTKLIPILAWIGRYRSISSDSSTCMQSGINSVYFSLQGFCLKKLRVGWKDNQLLQSSKTFARLPCSCPICAVLLTSELFFCNGINSVSHRLITLHNINVMGEYSRIWSELAREVKSVEEFQEHIKRIDTKNGVVAQAINYIEELENGSNVIDIGETITKDIRHNRTLKKLIRRYEEYHGK